MVALPEVHSATGPAPAEARSKPMVPALSVIEPVKSGVTVSPCPGCHEGANASLTARDQFCRSVSVPLTAICTAVAPELTELMFAVPARVTPDPVARASVAPAGIVTCPFANDAVEVVVPDSDALSAPPL